MAALNVAPAAKFRRLLAIRAPLYRVGQEKSGSG
jgi:hypothetical protein